MIKTANSDSGITGELWCFRGENSFLEIWNHQIYTFFSIIPNHALTAKDIYVWNIYAIFNYFYIPCEILMWTDIRCLCWWDWWWSSLLLIRNLLPTHNKHNNLWNDCKFFFFAYLNYYFIIIFNFLHNQSFRSTSDEYEF